MGLLRLCHVGFGALVGLRLASVQVVHRASEWAREKTLARAGGHTHTHKRTRRNAVCVCVCVGWGRKLSPLMGLPHCSPIMPQLFQDTLRANPISGVWFYDLKSFLIFFFSLPKQTRPDINWARTSLPKLFTRYVIKWAVEAWIWAASLCPPSHPCRSEEGRRLQQHSGIWANRTEFWHLFRDWLSLQLWFN